MIRQYNYEFRCEERDEQIYVFINEQRDAEYSIRKAEISQSQINKSHISTNNKQKPKFGKRKCTESRERDRHVGK